MRRELLVGCFALGLTFLFAFGGTAEANPEGDVQRLLNTLEGPKATAQPEVRLNPDGTVRFLSAPSGAGFSTDGIAVKSAGPGGIARQFIDYHEGAFTTPSASNRYVIDRERRADARSYVRLQQTYAGLEVFGGQINVQLNSRGDVVSVLNTTLTDLEPFESGAITLTPGLNAAQAETLALRRLAALYPGVEFELFAPARLLVFAPEVLGLPGDPNLAWGLDLLAVDDVSKAQRVFVNASTGEVALAMSVVCDARNRRIYDGENFPRDVENFGVLSRIEGGPVSPVAQVNTLFDYVGITYDFYLDEHGRDSIDDAGIALGASARYCEIECPMFNAFYHPFFVHTYFGDGYELDADVVAHEITHGVTDFESGLIYFGESGAINESLSDIWGEFVDIALGPAQNQPEIHWRMGLLSPGGTIRSMSDPPSIPTFFGPPPDTYLGPGWYTGSLDNAGVHHNSGVGNKLCYLLVEGDVHNGIDVGRLGGGSQRDAISKVGSLFYEAQTNMLTVSSQYQDLGNILVQAARNLGFSNQEVVNVIRACNAVNILPEQEGTPARHFRAMSPEGANYAVLTWENPTILPELFEAVTIRRKLGSFPDNALDGVLVYDGDGERFVDQNLAPGEYFYRLDTRYDPEAGEITTQPLYARVVAGGGLPEVLTQFFDGLDAFEPFDLSFTQLYIEPVGDPQEADESGVPEAYINYNNYAATLRTNVQEFPVSAEGAVHLQLKDNGIENSAALMNFTTGFELFPDENTPPEVLRRVVFPYFGVNYPAAIISANGYVAFSLIDLQAHRSELTTDLAEMATLANHFAIRRVSPLFARLSPQTGGSVWVRNMADRFVVTFDKVPEYGTREGNSFQLELFYSGHIRITYGAINARRAVAGLSDGRGVPKQADDPESALLSDLSNLAPPSGVRIDPIPRVFVREGELVEFEVVARSASGVAPQLFLTPLPPGATFTPEGDGRALFTWQTDFSAFEAEEGRTAGAYLMTLCASDGDAQTCQPVVLAVDNVERPPVGQGLAITPEEPFRNSTLEASFEYVHLDDVPEGRSLLYWYRDTVQITALSGQTLVPPAATRPGQRWYFTYTPISSTGLAGETYVSPAVVISSESMADVNQDGKVDVLDAQLVINKAMGADIGKQNADVNGDGKVQADDVQLVLNVIIGQ